MTLICIITPQFKKKWQMAALAILANTLSGLNFLLLGKVSACGVALVAVIQALFAIRHTKRDTAPGKLEIAVFGVLYVIGGLLPYLATGTLASFGWLDVMPIVGALLYLGYLVQTREQCMRGFLLANASVYLVYDVIIRSTQVFAQLFSLISVTVALVRYRRRQ